MKQLKFMFAAAAAFGIASAQAALTTNTTGFVNQNFNDYAPMVAPNGTYTPELSYAGDSQDGDNESKIDCKVAGDNSDMALFVNTSTNPILCTVQNGGAPYSLVANKSLYIDTMVQFTVTPADDDPEEGSTDKLMVYLKEVVSEETTGEGDDAVVTTTCSTNFFVKSRAYKYDDLEGLNGADVTGYDTGISVSDLTKWYRLVVTVEDKVYGEGEFALHLPVFTVTVDGTSLTSGEGMYLVPGYADNKLFPSLLGGSDATIQSVGFAGEGVVDNIVAAEVFEAPDVVSFTFAIDIDGGVNSVVYTIGEGEDATEATISADEAAITVASGTKVTLNKINLKALYVLASDSAKEMDSKTISAAGEEFVVKTTALTGEGESAVPPGTTASQIGITNTEFASADNEQLNSLVKWATSAGKGSLELVNTMTFDTNGYPAGEGATAAMAYLLDCATTEVGTKKDDFKLKISFDEEGNPVVEGPDGAETYKNGVIVLEGRESLKEEHPWGPKADGHKFFRAFLKK